MEKTEEELFMKEALKEAQLAYEKGEIPIGAVVVKERKVIARAHNLKETLFDATAHAEILAIRQACEYLRNWRLLDCEIYTTLEPCPMCAGAIVMARLKRVVFGAYDPNIGAASSGLNLFTYPGLNHYTEVVGGILKEEAEALLKPFFSELRKKGEMEGLSG